jgi:multidrug efflux system membrane fusion protein
MDEVAMRRVLSLSVVVIVLVALGVWHFSPRARNWVESAVRSGTHLAAAADARESKSTQKGTPPGVAVTTAVAKTADFPIRRYAIGFVSSPAVVEVSARISSQVEEVHVRDGQMVHAGEVLFSLDDRALKAALAKDQATLAKDQALLVNAQADLNRAKDLMTRGTGTKQAYDLADASAKAAAATVNADEAAIEADQVQLSYATIKAPITGRLGAIKITKGNVVSTGNNNGSSSPLVTITQMNPLEATFSLPESDLPLLKKALATNPPAEVRLYRDDGKKLLAIGHLDFVDSTVDTASGTVEVKASMPNDDLTLWPGQFVDVVVEAGTMPAMTSIPTVAVQPGQKGSFVYVVKPDDTVEERPVTVAMTVGDNSAVSQGLKGGERVVTEGQKSLKQGTRVRIMNASASAGQPDRKVALEQVPGGAGK